MTTRCITTSGELHGHPAVHIDSDVLRVTVLPRKGADIYDFVDRSSGIDVLWKNPVGLRPPGSHPHPGSGDAQFLWNYEGAWQELFPNAGDACVLDGVELPFHGEVATLPWDHEVLVEGGEEVAVRFSVRTRRTTFRLDRVMRLRAGDPALELEETVTNVGSDPANYVWGHHCVLGEPFVEDGCELLAPAGTLTTPPELYEDTARLAPGQRRTWPMALTRTGEEVDLTRIPGPSARSHDDVYLTDLTAGWVAVQNPHSDLTFSLHWDPEVFRWIVNWQIYGGAVAPPFMGLAYGVGIEPWVDNRPLADAVAAGAARSLAPGERHRTVVRALVTPGRFDPGAGSP
jgi:hypothetical protein